VHRSHSVLTYVLLFDHCGVIGLLVLLATDTPGQWTGQGWPRVAIPRLQGGRRFERRQKMGIVHCSSPFRYEPTEEIALDA
jgi:hypothetical protein